MGKIRSVQLELCLWLSDGGFCGKYVVGPCRFCPCRFFCPGRNCLDVRIQFSFRFNQFWRATWGHSWVSKDLLGGSFFRGGASRVRCWALSSHWSFHELWDQVLVELVER